MTDERSSSPRDKNRRNADAVRIEREEVARFLIAADSYRFFVPFLAQENTVAEVARLLGVDASSVLYRVRQMLDLKLIVVTREEARGGRPIRYYRSSADAFFVPFTLTDAETITELTSQFTTDFQRTFDRALERTVQRAGVEHELGVHISRLPDGRWSRDMMPEQFSGSATGYTDWILSSDAPPLWNQHAILRLRRDHSKALQNELAALWEKYLKLESSDEPL